MYFLCDFRVQVTPKWFGDIFVYEFDDLVIDSFKTQRGFCNCVILRSRSCFYSLKIFLHAYNIFNWFLICLYEFNNYWSISLIFIFYFIY